MTQAFRLAMALVVASITLVARAQANPPPVPGGGGATGAPTTPYFLGGQQTYTYYDADWVYYGPGTLTVSPVGLDPYNGTQLITVHIEQGYGRDFYGSGVEVAGKLYFAIGSYFFQCDAPGWGSYHATGYPGTDHWVYLQ